MERKSIKGKLKLEGVEWGPGPCRNSRNWSKVQQKQVKKSERLLSEVDLYHNPDSLFRLVGEPNELEVFINVRKVAALVDLGVQLSSISINLAKLLELEVKSLRTILDLEGTEGLTIPYLGYVERRLWILEVKAFDRDILMLVVPDRSYCNRVPIVLDNTVYT